ncbi:hypothetical protein GCM10010486_73560 [Nonomuraea roseoviolacea subsp. carminata]
MADDPVKKKATNLDTAIPTLAASAATVASSDPSLLTVADYPRGRGSTMRPRARSGGRALPGRPEPSGVTGTLRE